jgi:hypothetical protein
VNVPRWDDIVKHFGLNKPFSFKDVYNYYEKYEKKPLDTFAVYKRIDRLKKKNKIRSIGAGLYIIDYKAEFKPLISEDIRNIYTLITSEFNVDICMWDTSWLHKFMVHQPTTSIFIVETDKFIMETIYGLLKENIKIEYIGGIYINPKEKEIFQYILGESSIVILPTVKESPSSNKVNSVSIPKIEKILVDLLFYEKLLIAYGGNEMKNIYEEVFNGYQINITTLYRYARNRGIKDKLQKFILNTNIEYKYVKER